MLRNCHSRPHLREGELQRESGNLKVLDPGYRAYVLCTSADSGMTSVFAELFGQDDKFSFIAPEINTFRRVDFWRDLQAYDCSR